MNRSRFRAVASSSRSRTPVGVPRAFGVTCHSYFPAAPGRVKSTRTLSFVLALGSFGCSAACLTHLLVWLATLTSRWNLVGESPLLVRMAWPGIGSTGILRGSGRAGGSFLDRICYGEFEVMRLLKSRVAGLSLHTLEDLNSIGAASSSLFAVTALEITRFEE
jgi:hypothetical protein